MAELTGSDTPSAPDTSMQVKHADLSSELWQSARDLVQAAVYTGIGEPILGVSQIIDKSAGTEIMDSAKAGLAGFGITAPEEAHGSMRQHARMLGNAAGMMLPFVLLHKSVGRGATKLLGEEAMAVRSNPALMGGKEFGMATGKQASLAFATGFAYDAAIRPSDNTQNGLGFVQDRFLNGLTGGATMATLSASSFALSRLGASEAIKSRFARAIFSDPISTSVLAAVPAGLVSAEAHALRSGNLLPTAAETGQSIYQMGFVGFAFGGAHKLGMFNRPDSKTLQEADKRASQAQPEQRQADPRPDSRQSFMTGEIEGVETPMQRAQRLSGAKEGQEKPAGDMERSKELYFAKVKGKDGSTSDVVIRPFAEEINSLMRVRRAEVSHNVNQTIKSLTGVDTPSLPLVLREQVTLPKIGKGYETEGTITGTVMIQENGGKQLGSQLREWANQAEGMERSAEPATGSVTKLINNNPQVRELVARAAFDNMMKGNVDLVEFSQQTIREGAIGADLAPSNKLRLTAIDNKNDFTLLEKPSWGFGSQFGLSLEVAKALEGKRLGELSPQLEAEAQAILKVFSSEKGRQRLLNDGLTLPEIEAAQMRLTSLLQEGFPRHLGEMNFYADEANQQLTASLNPEYDAEGGAVREYLKSRDENLVVVRENGRLKIKRKP
jgi:hypothetical protein